MVLYLINQCGILIFIFNLELVRKNLAERHDSS